MENNYKKGIVVIDFDNLVGSIADKQKATGRNLDLSRHGIDKFMKIIEQVTNTYFHKDYKYVVATQIDKLLTNLNRPQQFIATVLMKYLNILGFETFNIEYKKSTKCCPNCGLSTSYDVQSGGDIKIAIEIISKIFMDDEIKSIVLISGDADFSSLLQFVKDYKREVDRHVLYFENSGNYLLGQYSTVHMIDEFWDEISKN